MAYLSSHGLGAGSVVGIQAGFTPDAIALFLAILECRGVAALIPESLLETEACARDGCLDVLIRPNPMRQLTHCTPGDPSPLLEGLRSRGSAGIVIFTSGSSGVPKAALHDAERFLSKFRGQLKRLRTLAFLLFDHVAGIDTLCYSLASGSELVLPEARDPRTVCSLIATHAVEVLPASPTFLNLMLLSVPDSDHDLSSLRIITYGAEPMSGAVLARLTERFPHVRLIQKYGTTEFGSPRARSRDGASLWLNLKGDEIDARVVDGLLWVRTDRAMLGYLNAPSPFDEDGWMCTGDLVEQDGDWIRILGRKSDLINVGGEKVHPREVEDVILELDIVREVVVRGEAHPMTGQIVTAMVAPAADADPDEMRRAVRRHCRRRLERHKVPVRVTVADKPLTTARQKKQRAAV